MDNKKTNVLKSNFVASPIEKLALIDMIIDEIGKSIAEGKLRIGDVLPSERVLSEMFEVSRTSIRQAIKALEVLGVVETIHGSCTRLKKSSWELLINPIKFMSLLYEIDEFQLIKERKFIEGELIKIATKNISDEDINELENNISEMENLDVHAKELIDLDIYFHNIIIQSSGYKILPGMMLSINNLLRSLRKKNDPVEFNLKVCLHYHKKILDAIKERNSAKASEIMLEHINKAYEGFASRLKKYN